MFDEPLPLAWQLIQSLSRGLIGRDLQVGDPHFDDVRGPIIGVIFSGGNILATVEWIARFNQDQGEWFLFKDERAVWDLSMQYSTVTCEAGPVIEIRGQMDMVWNILPAHDRLTKPEKAWREDTVTISKIRAETT